MCGRQTTSDKERIDNEESVKVLEKATVKFMTMELKLRDEGLENMEKGISVLDGEGQVQEQGSQRLSTEFTVLAFNHQETQLSYRTSLVAQTVKNLPAMQETWV